MARVGGLPEEDLVAGAQDRGQGDVEGGAAPRRRDHVLRLVDGPEPPVVIDDGLLEPPGDLGPCVVGPVPPFPDRVEGGFHRPLGSLDVGVAPGQPYRLFRCYSSTPHSEAVRPFSI